MTDAILFILWGCFEVVLLATGKLVVCTVSLGRWRGQALSSAEHRIDSPAGALAFRRDRRLVITHNGLLFVGLLFYAALALALFAAADFSALMAGVDPHGLAS